MKIMIRLITLIWALLTHQITFANNLTFYAQSLDDLYVRGINDSGHIVGSLRGRNYFLGVGSNTDLGDFTPVAINNHDEILGIQTDGRWGIWKSGTISLLPERAINGAKYSLNSLNDSGVAVGYTVDGGQGYAIKFEQGGFAILGYGGAVSINNSGVAVGSSGSYLCDCSSVGTLWSNGTETIIGRPVEWPASNLGAAKHISNSGIIAGSDWYGAYILKDGIYEQAPARTYFYSNSDTMAVGNTYTLTNQSYGSIYRDGQLIDVNTVISGEKDWRIREIWHVSESGYMIGYGSYGTVMLSPTEIAAIPVPEPASVAILLAGLVVVGIAVRRKQIDA